MSFHRDDKADISKSCSSQEEEKEEFHLNQLKVYILKAELKQNIPVLDANLYVSISGSGYSLRTRTVKHSFFPQFNEKLYIPIDRKISNLVKLEIFLSNSRSDDKKIDKKKFRLTEILKIQNTWRLIHLYSDPSSYSGSLLLKFKLKTSLNPTTSQSIFKQVQVKPALIQHVLWVEIIEIAGFGINESLQVLFELGFTSFISNPAKPQNQRWVWGKFGYLKEFVITLPEDSLQVPNLIIKIISQSSQKSLGSLQKSSFDLMKQGSKPVIPKWEELRLEDDSLAYPAFILMRVNLVALGQLEYFRPERVSFTSSLFEVRAMIFQAQNLEISDMGGLANPFITVSINGVSKKTQVFHQCLNPHWNEVLVWKIDLFLQNSLKNLAQIDLWQWNHSPIKNVRKASAIFDFSMISQEKTLKPIWLSMQTKHDQSNPRVLISLSMFKLENSKQIIQPVSVMDLLRPVDCRLKVFIIGPRNFQGFHRWMEKLFIKITAGNSKPVETKLLEIKKNEKNWNFMETLQIQLKVPTDPLYSPLVGFCLLGKNNEKEEVVGSACLSLDNFLPWVGKNDESSEDNEATDRTQISDKDSKDLTENKKNHEKIKEKWPGYQKKIIPRKEITTSFEKYFGCHLPFQTIELKRLESTKKLITSGFLRCKISLFTENDIKIQENLSESFKKVSVLYARLNIFSLKFLPTNPKHYFIKIQSSESSNQNIESDSIQGPTAILNTSYTLKLSLPSDNFLSFEVHPSNPPHNFSYFYLFDIEERWFNQKFQKIKSAEPTRLPIETLQMRNFDNSVSNVQLIICLDLLTEEELNKNPQQVFKGGRQKPFELRIIVWKVKDMDLKPKDLVVRAVLNDGQEVVEETDVHFGASDQAEFNWRFKFVIDLPGEEPFVKLELFDLKEMASFAVCRLDLEEFFDDCLQSDEPLGLGKEWVRLHDSHETTAGFALLEVKMVSLEQVHEFPAGSGREAPNVEPFLCIPKTGRNFDDIKNDILGMQTEKEKKVTRYKKCIALLVCVILIAAIPISLSVVL